ncbi:hypothetical protein JW930_01905 [Candidatus Woesearchaeota archaeon]|nr:hypothetical protein [Candidatus Woesearchaeota archaeon]
MTVDSEEDQSAVFAGPILEEIVYRLFQQKYYKLYPSATVRYFNDEKKTVLYLEDGRTILIDRGARLSEETQIDVVVETYDYASSTIEFILVECKAKIDPEESVDYRDAHVFANKVAEYYGDITGRFTQTVIDVRQRAGVGTSPNPAQNYNQVSVIGLFASNGILGPHLQAVLRKQQDITKAKYGPNIEIAALSRLDIAELYYAYWPTLSQDSQESDMEPETALRIYGLLDRWMQEGGDSESKHYKKIQKIKPSDIRACLDLYEKWVSEQAKQDPHDGNLVYEDYLWVKGEIIRSLVMARYHMLHDLGRMLEDMRTELHILENQEDSIKYNLMQHEAHGAPPAFQFRRWIRYECFKRESNEAIKRFGKRKGKISAVISKLESRYLELQVGFTNYLQGLGAVSFEEFYNSFVGEHDDKGRIIVRRIH